MRKLGSETINCFSKATQLAKGQKFTLRFMSYFCSRGWARRGERSAGAPLLPTFDPRFVKGQYEKQSDVTCPQIFQDQHNHVKNSMPTPLNPEEPGIPEFRDR